MAQVKKQNGTGSSSSKKPYKPHNASHTQPEHAGGGYKNVGYGERLIPLYSGVDSSCAA